MPLQTAIDLLSYLQDVSVNAPNTPDLDLATDYLESQGVELTPAVINYTARLIDINF